MKDFPFLILIVLPLFCGGQEQNATYKLFKDGENYERPIVYILEDSFEETYEEGGKVYLLNKKDRFVHNPNIHSSVEVKKEEVDHLNIQKPLELYALEEKEFQEKAEILLKETGVKPVPPIDHFILRIFILKEKDSDYRAYEVAWLP